MSKPNQPGETSGGQQASRRKSEERARDEGDEDRGERREAEQRPKDGEGEVQAKPTVKPSDILAAPPPDKGVSQGGGQAAQAPPAAKPAPQQPAAAKPKSLVGMHATCRNFFGAYEVSGTVKAESEGTVVVLIGGVQWPVQRGLFSIDGNKVSWSHRDIDFPELGTVKGFDQDVAKILTPEIANPLIEERAAERLRFRAKQEEERRAREVEAEPKKATEPTRREEVKHQFDDDDDVDREQPRARRHEADEREAPRTAAFIPCPKGYVRAYLLQGQAGKDVIGLDGIRLTKMARGPYEGYFRAVDVEKAKHLFRVYR